MILKLSQSFKGGPWRGKNEHPSIGIRLDKGSIAEFEFMQPTSHKTKQKQTDAEGKLIVIDTSREENVKLEDNHLPLNFIV